MSATPTEFKKNREQQDRDDLLAVFLSAPSFAAAKAEIAASPRLQAVADRLAAARARRDGGA